MKLLSKIISVETIQSLLIGLFLCFFSLGIYNLFSITVYSPEGMLYGFILLIAIYILSLSSSYLDFTWIDLLIGIMAGSYLVLFYHVSEGQTYTVILLLCLYVGIRIIKKISFKILYYFLLIICFGLVTHGYLQLLGIASSGSDFFKLTGIYKNPSIYSGIILLVIIVPIGYIIHTFRYRRFTFLWMISVLLLALTLPILILSGSRTAWIGVSISTLYMIFKSYRIKIKCSLQSIVFILLLGGITIGCGYGIYQYKKDSADGRLLIWKVSWNMIKEKPLTGFGPDGFKTYYMQYQAEYLSKSGNDREKYVAGSNHLAYNEFIRVWVEYGVVGLVVYISILWIFLSIRGKTLLIYSLKGVLIGYMVWGMFNFPAEVLTIQVLIVVTLAFLARRVKPVRSINRISGMTIKSVVILLLIAVSIKERQLSLSYRTFSELLTSYKRLERDLLITQLNELETHLKDEPGYWSFYCTTLYHFNRDDLLKEKIHCWIKVFPSPGNYLLLGDVHLRNKEFEQAEQSYLKAYNMIPARQSARGKLVWLYKELGDEKRAELLAEEILNEDVKIYSFETYRLHQELKKVFGENSINFSNLKTQKDAKK